MASQAVPRQADEVVQRLLRPRPRQSRPGLLHAGLRGALVAMRMFALREGDHVRVAGDLSLLERMPDDEPGADLQLLVQTLERACDDPTQPRVCGGY